MTLKQFTPGEPLSEFPGSTWNAFVESAKGHIGGARRRRRSGVGVAGVAAPGGGGVAHIERPYVEANVTNATTGIMRPLEVVVITRQQSSRYLDLRRFGEYYQLAPSDPGDEPEDVWPVENDWPLNSNAPRPGYGDHQMTELETPHLTTEGPFLAKRWATSEPVLYDADDPTRILAAANRLALKRTQKIGIVLDTIASGATGRVAIGGIVEGWVYIDRLDDRYAGPPPLGQQRVGKIDYPEDATQGHLGHYLEGLEVQGEPTSPYYVGRPTVAYSGSRGPLRILHASRRDREETPARLPAVKNTQIGQEVNHTTSDTAKVPVIRGTLGNTLITILSGETETVSSGTLVSDVDIATMQGKGWRLLFEGNTNHVIDSENISIHRAVFIRRLQGVIPEGTDLLGHFLQRTTDTRNRWAMTSEHRGVDTSAVHVAGTGTNHGNGPVITPGQIYSKLQWSLAYETGGA